MWKWSIDERRDLEPVGLGIDFGVDNEHHDTSGRDAGRVPVTLPSFTCRKRLLLAVGGGRLRMTGKALEPFQATWYPLSTYPWDPGAKSSTASEQMASWLSGYPGGVQHDRPLQGCSAVRAEEKCRRLCTTENNCSSHLGGPGEPRGATRDPQGRFPWLSDGPDNEGVARRHVPARERG